MAQTPRKFNPLAAYGTVTPPHRGATHYQDGGYFGPDGKLIWEDAPATPPKKVKTTTTVVDGEAGTMTEETVETEETALPPADPKEVLSGWLRGETKLTHPEVVKQVKAGFSVVLAKKADIIDYLVNTAHLVPAELVRVAS